MGKGERSPPTSTRRVLLAEFAGMAVAIAGISALVKGPLFGAARAGRGLQRLRRRRLLEGRHRGQRRRRRIQPGRRAPPRSPSAPSSSAPASRLPNGQAATYSDPADGSPDILIRESDGSLKAFSAVCTHAGCTVGYEGGIIICPCHGGEYSAETGEVIAGPPPSGLAPKKVLEAGGQIYAVPS